MSTLTEKASDLMSQLQDKLPEQRIGLVPADAFFVRKVELPEGLSNEDADSVIRLDLEGISPFPIEQLAWGYICHEGSRHAFAYATPRARLKRLNFDDLEGYYQLFPGFVSLIGEPTEKSLIRFVSQNGVLSAIFTQQGETVPERIVSRKIKADLLTDDILLEARQSLMGTLETDEFAVEDGLWLGESAEIGSDGTVHFKHRHLSPGTSLGTKDIALQVSDRCLWAMDLRDTGFATRESQTRQRSKLIWQSLKVGAWVGIGLLIFQLLNFGLQGFNILLEKKIANIEPLAVRVENKFTLATRLNQSTEEDLKPFILMESINAMRPDSVFFEKVRSRAFNELQVQGKSTEGVTPVNAFADSINQLPFILAVENNSQTRNNQTSFELVITFSEIPPGPEGGFIISDEDEPTEETDSAGGSS